MRTIRVFTDIIHEEDIRMWLEIDVKGWRGPGNVRIEGKCGGWQVRVYLGLYITQKENGSGEDYRCGGHSVKPGSRPSERRGHR